MIVLSHRLSATAFVSPVAFSALLWSRSEEEDFVSLVLRGEFFEVTKLHLLCSC